MRKPTTALALAAITAVALTGCSSGGGAVVEEGEDLVIDGEVIADAELYSAAIEEGTLTLYDNYPEAPWRALLDQFEEDTGITVEHVRLITPQLYERVVSESGAGQLEADAVGMGDPTLMAEFADRGILASYESPVGTEALTPEQYAEDFTYYSSAQLVMLPSYNSAVVEEDGLPVPESWEDLTDPELTGEIGMTPIGTGGSSFSVYYFLQDVLGESYWEDLAAVEPTMYESVVPLTQDIVRGEVPYGVTSLGTIAEQIDDGAPVVPLFLPEGTPAFTNLVAVTEDAANPNAARVYLNWLLSLEGQNTLVEETSEFPIREDADSPTIEGIDVPTVESGEIVVPPFSVWTDNRDALTEEWDAVFN